MDNSNGQIKSYDILIALIIALGAITFYFQMNHIGTVYTHLYYIPIIVASCWFQKKGYIVFAIMGTILLVTHYFFNPGYSYLEDVMRLLVMLLISYLVVKISVEEKSCAIESSEQSENLKIAYEKLKRHDARLKETNKKLEEKLKEVEILYRVMANKKS